MRWAAAWSEWSLKYDRYYGDSLPFPISLNTTAEKMQFLTNENGLKDFVVFANQFQWKNFSVLPKEVPWIVVGSSYGGNRAAALRKLYPETVFAAYASAAAVQHRKDMSVCKLAVPLSCNLMTCSPQM